MQTSHDDLNKFHAFATVAIRNDATLSVEELVTLWRRSNEREAANDSIRQSLAEFDAGAGIPIDEFLNSMKSKHNL